MPHPARHKIDAFIDKTLSDNDLCVAIEQHLANCEFCQEYADEYRRHELEVSDVLSRPDSRELTSFLGSLELKKSKGMIIPLRVLEPSKIQGRVSLAADTGKPETSPPTSIATLYSENPEVVMKLMHDPKSGSDYLQLLSDSPELISNVLVRAPEATLEWITDGNGRADLSTKAPSDAKNLHWQICLPQATFDLEPLIYDPEKIEYSKESVLETERGDRIKVTFEGKTAGKQITVELLELEHRSDFESVKIILLGKGESQTHSAEAGKPVLFRFPENTKDINIRIFH